MRLPAVPGSLVARSVLIPPVFVAKSSNTRNDNQEDAVGQGTGKATRPEAASAPTMEAGARRKVLLLPFGYFAAVLMLALVFAVINRALGSVNLLPGEHLRLPAALMIFSYAGLLSRHLRRAGLRRSEHGRLRTILVAASSAVAAPVLGLLIAPAVNGLAGIGEETTVLAPVARIEARHMRHGRRLYYYARIADAAVLPRGAYYLGRYDQGWAPMYENDSLDQIHTVRIRYRTGLLGARTLLEAVPVSASLP